MYLLPCCCSAESGIIWIDSGTIPLDHLLTIFPSTEKGQSWAFSTSWRWPGEYGGCFTNVSRALQNIISKFVYYYSRISYENFKLKLCACAQSHVLGTRAKCQLEILGINVIFGIVYFREIILESSQTLVRQPPGDIHIIHTGGHRWRQLRPTSSIITDAVSVD